VILCVIECLEIFFFFFFLYRYASMSVLLSFGEYQQDFFLFTGRLICSLVFHRLLCICISLFTLHLYFIVYFAFDKYLFVFSLWLKFILS
jgi:hypothetical protein